MTIQPTAQTERFLNLVNSHQDIRPWLPLVHNTTGICLNNIIADNKIKAENCKIYNTDLLYLFYGKPAYVINKPGGKPATKEGGESLICFVLNLDRCPDFYRLFSFDTGACFGKRYDQYMPSGLNADSFELPAEHHQPAKVVAAFYGSNEDYYVGNIRSDVSVANTDFVSQTLINMAQSLLSEDFDERCCSMEIQLNCDIELKPRILETIVMPSVFYDDKNVKDACERWEVKPILYRLRRSPVAARTEVIFERLGQFYDASGYF